MIFYIIQLVITAIHEPVLVSVSLVVHFDLAWVVHAHGHVVDPLLSSVLSDLPSTLTIHAFQVLVSRIVSSKVCKGHPDANFVAMAKSHNGKFLSPKKDLVCYLDSYSSVEQNGIIYPCTVRHAKCELLVKEKVCIVCNNYRSNLRAMYSNFTKNNNTVSVASRRNIRYMSSPQKRAKMLKMKAVLFNRQRQLKRLKAKLKVLTDKHGIED